MESLYSILDYEPHKKSQIQIEGLLLNQAHQDKSQQWKDIT